MKKFLILILAAAGFFAFSTDGFKKTASGLRYKIYTKSTGRKAMVGDIIKLHMIIHTSTDSLLDNSYTNGQPYDIRIEKSGFAGDLMEGLLLLSKGDSATFLVSADSMPPANRPPFLSKKGSYLKFDVKLVELQTEAEYKAEATKMASKQNESDDKVIQDWLKSKGLKAQKTSSGLYYIMEKEGTGAQATSGSTVSVHYSGFLLNGKKFDSSLDRGEPISFTLGQHQVISGWDEGIALFKVGGKGKLIIPSSLAYGSHGAGADIPANAVLMFDIELVGVK